MITATSSNFSFVSPGVWLRQAIFGGQSWNERICARIYREEEEAERKSACFCFELSSSKFEPSSNGRATYANVQSIFIWSAVSVVAFLEEISCNCERFEPRSHFKNSLILIALVNGSFLCCPHLCNKSMRLETDKGGTNCDQGAFTLKYALPPPQKWLKQ